MFRLRTVALAACVLAMTVFFVRAQNEPDLKAILKNAIKAHGGEKALAKLAAVTVKYKGTIELMGKARDVTGENSFQKPDKLKSELTLDFDGKAIPVIIVYNGEKMWRSVLGKTEEIKDDKALTEMRQALQVEGAGSMIDFLKAPYELGALGEVKVKDQAAVGIRVSKKDQRDINIYFDKKTHLVVKTEMRVYDAESGQEVTQEKFISNYKDINGLKTGTHVVIHKDGKPFMEFDVTETQILEKLDDSTFAMP